MVHTISPHGCGAPSQSCVSERERSNFHICSRPGCGGAGSATSWTADREVSAEGGGGDHTYHKPQSVPWKVSSRTLTHGEQRADSSPQERRPSGPSAGLARAPGPLEQTLETGRNFPERTRGGRAGPAARWAAAAVAPQLPERQKAPAPPAPPGPRPRAPQGRRTGRRAHRQPDSRRVRGVDEVPPAGGAPRPVWGAHARTKRVTCGELGEHRKTPEA